MELIVEVLGNSITSYPVISNFRDAHCHLDKLSTALIFNGVPSKDVHFKKIFFEVLYPVIVFLPPY
jgi:hypothetical protein